MDICILRLQGALMSFGGPVTSKSHRPTRAFPQLSMITGLLANALGYDQSEFDRHDRLQERITYAVREDVVGEEITDYQTVRLNPEDRPQDPNPRRLEMQRQGWTTWSAVDERNKDGENARRIVSERDYWAGSKYTIALHVEDADQDQIMEVLRRPARPLFIGRKCCLPSAPIARFVMEAPGPEAALRSEKSFFEDTSPRARIWYESKEGKPITDRRDWKNQIHVGQRYIVRDRLSGDAAPGD
ncbi:CRISPR system Cascade subunit CasD [Salinibacter ruber]|uniref:type I-E CRISPR-associated protein Cas5/CasD n=1 Tax=Salinibacter ruber TaxID=146919 RepID=UPI0021679ADB|nr:type I-E CRISPR-associated protein Cas5/CasD [Salinibacter ruber]MCS4048040.1 CRISPR system Cascade subunit CasD [Salinibacter ruber]